MKNIVVLAVLSYIALVQGMSDEIRAVIHEHALECVKDSGVDEAILNKAKEGHYEDDDKLKDFMFCMMMKPEFITSEGKLQVDEIKEKVAAEWGEETAEKLVKECGDKHESTPKDTAFEFAKCFHEIIPEESEAE